jgi:hypothetical protein
MNEPTQINSERPIRRVYISAAAHPDGKGAIFAWLDENTRKRGVGVTPGSIPIEALYSGCLLVLKRIRAGVGAQIVTDSALFSGQFHEISPACGRRVHALRARIVMLARERRLEVDVTCVPRADNRAWKLLKRFRVGPLEQEQLELDLRSCRRKVIGPPDATPPI